MVYIQQGELTMYVSVKHAYRNKSYYSVNMHRIRLHHSRISLWILQDISFIVWLIPSTNVCKNDSDRQGRTLIIEKKTLGHVIFKILSLPESV